MGKWIENQDLKKENKERDKVRKEKLAGYFLNLSQLTFVALVLGGLHRFMQMTERNWISSLLLQVLY